jgi:dolichol-phosphate hexosyltransferase
MDINNARAGSGAPVLAQRPVELEVTGSQGKAKTVVERQDEESHRTQKGSKRYASPDEVTVVVPTLNEAAAIGKVIDDLRHAGYERILVIDGDSTDATRQIAFSKGADVVKQHGAGKAGALKTAFGLVETPYMLVMDGDDTYKAADIDDMLTYAGEFDEVIGARTEGRENIPRLNRFGNWVISKVFKLLFGAPVTDVLSGMYLLKTGKVREIETTSGSFDIEVEIASSIAASGSITQVPISYGKRLGEQKLRPSHGGRILSTLFWMAYYNNPVVLFGSAVALLGVPAFGVLLWVLYERLFFGVYHGIYALFGLGLLLIATQAAGVAMISLLMKRSEKRMLGYLQHNSP